MSPYEKLRSLSIELPTPSVPSYTEQHLVANGASELFAVEIELIAELADD